MFIKTLRCLSAGLTMAIPLIWPMQAMSADSCVDLFRPVEQVKNGKFSFLPKLITERHQRAIVRLAKKDGRLAALRLSEASSVLDRIDNISSAALMRTMILHRKAPTNFGDYLKSLTAKSNSISSAVASQQDVPAHVKVLFDSIESRYRAAIEVLGAAYLAKTGKSPKLESSEYVYRLLEVLRDSMIEISSNRKYGDYFSGIDERLIDWNLVARNIESSLASQTLFAYEAPPETAMFQKEFLAMVDPELPLPAMIHEVGFYLEHQLEALPVGISYRVAELTSTVRFGGIHFYGNWYEFNSTDRAAYIRKSRKLGGIMEAELNIPNRKKKLLAVLLDRSFQNLDPAFSLKNKTGQCFSTCGSFPPIMFIRAGVPIVSPAYITPTPTIISLSLQKFFGFNNVKSIRFSQLSPTGVAMDVPIILVHDGAIANVEIAIYMATLSSLGTVLYSLF